MHNIFFPLQILFIGRAVRTCEGFRATNKQGTHSAEPYICTFAMQFNFWWLTVESLIVHIIITWLDHLLQRPSAATMLWHSRNRSQNKSFTYVHTHLPIAGLLVFIRYRRKSIAMFLKQHWTICGCPLRRLDTTRHTFDSMNLILNSACGMCLTSAWISSARWKYGIQLLERDINEEVLSVVQGYVFAGLWTAVFGLFWRGAQPAWRCCQSVVRSRS